MYGQKYLVAIESSLIAMMEPILNPLWVYISYGGQSGMWALAGGIVRITALIFRFYWVEVREKTDLPDIKFVIHYFFYFFSECIRTFACFGFKKFVEM